MDKKNLQLFIIAPIIFLALLAGIMIPTIIDTHAVSTANFNVSLTLSNVAPTITYVANISTSPNAGTTKVVTFMFNATDLNGVADIPSDNALIIINYSGVTHTSTNCSVTGSGTKNTYYCDVTVDYFDTAGYWTINASIFDGAAAKATDLNSQLNLGTTYAISLNKTSLTFSGSAGDQNVAPSNAPQTVLNKGNGAFTTMNIKAFDLEGGTDSISAGQFSANITDSAVGTTLVNNSDVAIVGGTLAVNGTRNVYVYLDIPEGIADSSYSSGSEWVVSMS